MYLRPATTHRRHSRKILEIYENAAKFQNGVLMLKTVQASFVWRGSNQCT
jgi:hypothetical protein